MAESKLQEDSVLLKIIKRKEEDIKAMGFTFGSSIPKERTRNIIPFLPKQGAILEIKRASPSKGDIALNLDPINLAYTYKKAGASAISVLTEINFFKGSLNDLIEVANKVSDVAILRKDFIIHKEEIEVSFLAGADAVLLIARILDTSVLIEFALECARLCITPFIEIRDENCIAKFRKVHEALKGSSVQAVAGINSRDLSTFTIDTLIPSIYRNFMEGNSNVVFESGILTGEAAAFVAERGFYGILVGESVAKNPKQARGIVSSFEQNIESIDNIKNNISKAKNALFWENIAKIIYKRKLAENIKPLVKICGITNIDDAICATAAGSDMLGFVFCKQSVRNVDIEIVKYIKTQLKQQFDMLPLFVGVITDTRSDESKNAIALANENVLDALQYHGFNSPSPSSFGANTDIGYGYYNAIRLCDANDIETIKSLLALGHARVLLDSFDKNTMGGSGVVANKSLVLKAAKLMPIWLSGGITPDNISEILSSAKIELIDLSSGVEKSGGVKCHDKINKLFENINKYYKVG